MSEKRSGSCTLGIPISNDGGSYPGVPEKRRKVSATRGFPYGCGSSAPLLNTNSTKELIGRAGLENPSVISFEPGYAEIDEPKDDLSYGEGREAMEFSGAMEPLVVTPLKVLEPDTKSLSSESNRKCYPPQRRISAARDCGDAFNHELVDNVEGKSGWDVIGAMNEHEQGRAASHCELKKQDTLHSGGTSGKEPVKLGEVNSFKRKLSGNLEDEHVTASPCQVEEAMTLEPSTEMMFVLALAAPNSLAKQGQCGFNAKPSCDTVRCKGKDHDMDDNSNRLSKEKSRNGNPRDQSHQTTESLRARMDSYQCDTDKGQLNLDEKYDSPTHDDEDEISSARRVAKGKQVMHKDPKKKYVEDEYDSPGNDKEDEHFALVPRSEARTVTLIPFGHDSVADKTNGNESVVTRNKVRETLRLFQGIYRKFLQDEEAKPKGPGNTSLRIDLACAKILKDKNKCVNTGKKIIGPVPGIEVGDEFQFRVELAIIGLHRQYQGGIDFVREGRRILATSIVCQDGHDDIDGSDILIYTGEGGNAVNGAQAKDQKLERGNLALKNNIDEDTPVRVIRGVKEPRGPGSVGTRGKLVAKYIYDGLYSVEKYWQESGRHGVNVFKFQLRRKLGQPELAYKTMKRSKKVKVAICEDDISQGKEKVPIRAVNTLDNQKPPTFSYITRTIHPPMYSPTPAEGCDCTDGCSDSKKCSCVVKNGGEIPFNHDGAIVFAKPLVYECGPSCKCPPSCHNRVSQRGIKFRLEVFKTKSRGWGVRSLTSIPSGSFICEYTGELLENNEAEQRTGKDEYLFNIGNNYNDFTLWEGVLDLIPPSLQSSIGSDTVEEAQFAIDALEYGNVGRFINHSCSPNLFAQNVLYDHDDKKMPHILLFAADNIPPLQELTYDYNYKLESLNQVCDSNGIEKKKECYCGSEECTGRLY